MKILVVSDTHGHDENLMRVLQREWPIDALIHCGDLEGSEDYIPEAVECPCFFVRGNNDFFSDFLIFCRVLSTFFVETEREAAISRYESPSR